jgi:dienelactone hydrolase
VLYQKLDPTKLAALGYSLGSMGAFEMAGDPRLKTTVHISGGAMDKAVLPNLHNPAAFFCGDSSDIAHENCESDFEMVKVPVFYGVFPGDHLGILGSHATQINQAVATWLRWRLMDDATLDMSFVGNDCAVCQDKTWVVKQHDLDQAP